MPDIDGPADKHEWGEKDTQEQHRLYLGSGISVATSRSVNSALLVVGTWPKFMKIAPLVRTLSARNIPHVLCHVGQHYDVATSEVSFRQLGIPQPQVELEVGSGTHAEQTAQVMLAFEPVVLQKQPSSVVVVGDFNSTLACALVAQKKHIPVVHVEAGVRSFDRGMPEEINGLLTDQLADLCLTPSPDADLNLFA
jgi:UDP-N-acetylglucosamine 2-epimerase (non-hydrolysing)